MKYLLYCIFAAPADRTLAMPECPEGHGIHLVEKHGLCSAVGEFSDRGATYKTSHVLLYHETIAWFHNQVTVIPFRFGTVLDECADAERLLERRTDHYKKLLQDLKGCSEMGIRAIVEEPRLPRRESLSVGDLQGSSSKNPGKMYLSQRRICHQRDSVAAQANELAVERYRSSFEGIFRKFRSEVSRSEGTNGITDTVMRSLYFLVPKELLAHFRRTFADLASREDAKLLLSGPWPPYNFVLPGDVSAK